MKINTFVKSIFKVLTSLSSMGSYGLSLSSKFCSGLMNVKMLQPRTLLLVTELNFNNYRSTKISKVNLYASIYRLFHKDTLYRIVFVPMTEEKSS